MEIQLPTEAETAKTYCWWRLALSLAVTQGKINTTPQALQALIQKRRHNNTHHAAEIERLPEVKNPLQICSGPCLVEDYFYLFWTRNEITSHGITFYSDLF